MTLKLPRSSCFPIEMMASVLLSLRAVGEGMRRDGCLWAKAIRKEMIDFRSRLKNYCKVIMTTWTLRNGWEAVTIKASEPAFQPSWK